MFKIGDIITYCDEDYVVVTNQGNQGTVKMVGDESTLIKGFYWEAYGEKCVLKTTI